jgi:hypothetical protein
MIPWYPQKGQKGYDWQRTLRPDIPYLNDDKSQRYKDMTRNWRNSGIYWYSMNPTSYTPQNQQRDVSASVARNQQNTQQGLDQINRQMNARGLGQSSANQYAQRSLGTSQANTLANEITGIQDQYSRGKYNDWLKWQATAAERKNQLDKLNLQKGQMALQAAMMNQDPDSGGGDAMGATMGGVSAGLGLLGGLLPLFI